MNYPGHNRIDAFRGRLTELRRDTDDALDRMASLQTDVEALRSEVARLTVTIGAQIAGLQEAVERLETRLADAEAESRGAVADRQTSVPRESQP